MIRLLSVLFFCLGTVAAAQETVQEPAQAVSALGVVLRGLDKVSGQTVDVELPWGGTGDVFGLQVVLGDCRYPADNPTGDAYAFLTIRDKQTGQLEFEGWMVASSPALNPLDHNRYDVWVLRCITS